MTKDEDGRVAVVTGGAQGLGYATAEALIAAGFKAAILGRTESKLKSAAAALGNDTLALVADISDPDSVRSAFSALDRAFGRLDVLVNNAGLFRPFDIAGATDAQIRETVGSNFLGPLYCTREAARRMQGSGDIVNVSSETVRRPFPNLSIYGACKAGVEFFSTAMRDELKAQGVRVTTLRAGAMTGAGERHAALAPPEFMERTMKRAAEIGFLEFCGAGFDPRAAASAIVFAVTAPRDANLDLIELRARV